MTVTVAEPSSPAARFARAAGQHGDVQTRPIYILQIDRCSPKERISVGGYVRQPSEVLLPYFRMLLVATNVMTCLSMHACTPNWQDVTRIR